jgi:hypothetical protein
VARRTPNIGRSEITFMVGVVILLAMTFAAVALDQPADPTLVAAAIGIIGVPVFLQSDRKKDDDDPR